MSEYVKMKKKHNQHSINCGLTFNFSILFEGTSEEKKQTETAVTAIAKSKGNLWLNFFIKVKYGFAIF